MRGLETAGFANFRDLKPGFGLKSLLETDDSPEVSYSPPDVWRRSGAARGRRPLLERGLENSRIKCDHDGGCAAPNYLRL